MCVCVCVCASKRACMSSERERENMCVHACVHYVDVKVHSMLDVYCCDQRATRARVSWGKKDTRHKVHLPLGFPIEPGTLPFGMTPYERECGVGHLASPD